MFISVADLMLLLLIVTLLGLQIYSMYRIRSLSQQLAKSGIRQEALLRANGGAVVKMHRSILALEKRVELNAKRQQAIENKHVGSVTYEQASKLVQMGAAPEDLVKSCGLSQAEAKLVSLMAARGVVPAS